MIKNFYKKIYNNLNSNNIFYKYNNIKIKYSDLKKKIITFNSFSKKFNKTKNNKICVISNKSFDSYSLAISILLTNNTWIPLSKKMPFYRLKKIIKNLSPEIILTDEVKLKNQFSKYKKVKCYLIKDVNKYKVDNKLKISFLHKSDDLAMIFFTSGSTGEAKGVPIKQKNFLPSLYAQINNLYKNKKKLIFADFHDLSFVISLNILLPCVYLKGTIVPALNIIDIVFAEKHIIKNDINVLVTVPSFINQIKNSTSEKNTINKVKIIVMCGETFHSNICKYLIKKFRKSQIYNCYGSTELSPWVFNYKFNVNDLKLIDQLNIVPIGKRFYFAKYKIINKELLISGQSVVDGYLNKEFNKDRFLKIKNNNWYKTGDIAIKKNGLIFLKGRKDTQVKIKGYRVDLLDIESALRLNKNITNNLVFFKRDNNYKNRLIAIIEISKKISNQAIYEYLKNKLPDYMIPNEFIFLKKFPKNKNGKIDRAKILKKIV